MPELPEVETIRRGLSQCIIHKKIKKIEVFCEKSFIGKKEDIYQTEIERIERKGKALIFQFQNGKSMISHLRMTGQMIFVGDFRFAGGHPNENFVSDLPNKQTRVQFDFLDGTKMFFNDQRKFGFCKILPSSQVSNDPFIIKLGKEPWDITPEEFFSKINKKQISIKAALLDQTIMAGLGNIYADETLFLSSILATRRCSQISKDEAEKLVFNARKIMEKSIESGGSTIKNYVKADGTRGNYLDLFANVYGREGEKCVRCGKPILKTRVAGRGTYYCKECQK